MRKIIVVVLGVFLAGCSDTGSELSTYEYLLDPVAAEKKMDACEKAGDVDSKYCHNAFRTVGLFQLSFAKCRKKVDGAYVVDKACIDKEVAKDEKNGINYK